MVKFIDYLNKCLQNDEFRKYWEAENLTIDEDEENIIVDNFSIWKALNSLTEDELDDIIKNRGIKATTKIKTTIEFYSDSKDCPVENFLNSINKKTQRDQERHLNNQKLKAKTLKNIYRLALEGSNARAPLSEYVADGIYELRTKQQSNIDRIFYFFVFGNKIILTNGYIKKSQKMEQNEFEKAKKYRDEYLRR